MMDNDRNPVRSAVCRGCRTHVYFSLCLLASSGPRAVEGRTQMNGVVERFQDLETRSQEMGLLQSLLTVVRDLFRTQRRS